MKKKLLAALLACVMLLSACQYIVVEDGEETQVGLIRQAYAETEETPTAAPANPTAESDTYEPAVVGSRDGEGESGIAQLQQMLVNLNYLVSEADGIFGAQTESAIKEFQARNGLEQTGICDEETLKALNSASAVPMPTPEPTPLAKGAKGDDVKAIQQKLKVYGFLSGGADGDFGANTDNALKAYQKYQYEMGLIEMTPAPTPDPTPTPEPTFTPEPTIASEATGEVDATDEPDDAPAGENTENTNDDGENEPAELVYEPDGVVTDELKKMLFEDEFQIFREELGKGSSGWEVLRMQYRLSDLNYQWDVVDGVVGPNTIEALTYFQKLNKLGETGVADRETQMKLFSDEAIKSDKPKHMYHIKISVADQRVYAYKWVNGKYSKLVRTMVCSTGTKSDPTPYGTYQAGGACGRWYYFKKFDCWAQYAYRINGPYLFHSVLYSEKDTSTLRKSSVNNLGSRASHGCVRLKVDDAKWIYNNCHAGTSVTVY